MVLGLLRLFLCSSRPTLDDHEVPAPQHNPQKPEDLDYGPWMLVGRRRNKGQGRGGGSDTSNCGTHVHLTGRDGSNRTVGFPPDDPDSTVATTQRNPRHVGLRGGTSSSGRGGSNVMQWYTGTVDSRTNAQYKFSKPVDQR